MINFTTQIDAENSLTCDFIEFFQNLYEIFGFDYIKMRIIPIFDDLIQDGDHSGTLKPFKLLFFLNIKYLKTQNYR
jgi:hypothetical protein